MVFYLFIISFMVIIGGVYFVMGIVDGVLFNLFVFVCCKFEFGK